MKSNNYEVRLSNSPDDVENWIWELDGQQISVRKTGYPPYYPCASDIYTLINGLKIKHDSKIVDVGSPKEQLKDIRFSRIGAKLVLNITFDKANMCIMLSAFALYRNTRVCIHTELRELVDSIVDKNVWRSTTANYESTLEILRRSDIEKWGKITLHQYFELVKESKKNEFITVEIIDDAINELRDHPIISDENEIPALNADLYPYQKVGYCWMKFITQQGCSCVLGDEMGLGKTLQVIALITSQLSSQKSPNLVIAPVTLLENWRREFEKFTSGVDVYIHHGSKRTGFYTDFLEHDVVIISYATAVSDQSILHMVTWNILVIDEAQAIKNPYAKRTKAIKNLKRNVAIAVTGTPFENHLTDLWSIMDFVENGYLGTLRDFNNRYEDSVHSASELEPYISPLLLRRRVSEVAKDLPERIDIPLPLEMSGYEASQYEAIRQQVLQKYGAKYASLPLLQKLRMYCTHPSIITEDNTDPIMQSRKYEMLCELLEETISINEKTILFTSYNRMFDILESDISCRFGIPVLQINGSTETSKRQGIIDKFTATSGPALLVLNPKAAGTGLNITAASRVIHYNLEWNPAVEDQASARAYRRGQKKTVFIYRLFYGNTVEEVVNDRVEKKRSMADSSVVGVNGRQTNSEDILRALMLSPKEQVYE